jgi:hypothetical protein
MSEKEALGSPAAAQEVQAPVESNTIDAKGPVSETANVSSDAPPYDNGSEPTGVVDMPSGWMYRQRRIFGFNIPHYASPRFQLILVSFVCFMCPGMFNALGGLGGGGKADATLADNMVSDRRPRDGDEGFALCALAFERSADTCLC